MVVSTEKHIEIKWLNISVIVGKERKKGKLKYVIRIVYNANILIVFCRWCGMDKREYLRKYRKTHKEQVKECQKKYYEEHKEQVKERQKKYNESHKEQVKEYQMKYYKEHKEHIKELKKAHYETHKEQIKEYRRRYEKEHKEHIKEKRKKYLNSFCNRNCLNCLHDDCILPDWVACYEIKRV